MYFVYVLWSSKLRKRYVGSAGELQHRLSDHNNGKNRFTKGGIPWILIHNEEYPGLSMARKREFFSEEWHGKNVVG